MPPCLYELNKISQQDDCGNILLKCLNIKKDIIQNGLKFVREKN